MFGTIRMIFENFSTTKTLWRNPTAPYKGIFPTDNFYSVDRSHQDLSTE